MANLQERQGTGAEQPQERKKPQKVFRFQGMRKHLDILRGYSERIREIEETVVQTRQRLDARIEEFRKQTGQKELFDAKKEIQAQIEVLQKERVQMVADLKETNLELRTLSQSVGEEKKKLNMKSATELRNRLASIESRIREKPLSSKEEKEISNEKNRLLKLLSMQDIFREKDEQIKELEDQKKIKETAVSIKKQEIDHQYRKLTEVTNQIGKIKKTVYPEDVKKMQEAVSALTSEKKELIEKKKEELAVIEQKSKEYEAKSAELERAKGQKDALVKQEQVIANLSQEKDVLEQGLLGDPCEQLNHLKKALGHQKTVLASTKGPITLPFHLVSQLLKFSIGIPKKSDELDQAINKIDQIYSTEEENFVAKKEELNSKIEKIASQINEERKALEKLPRPVFPRMSE